MKLRAYCLIRQCRREITESSRLIAILRIYYWLLNLYTVLSSEILTVQSNSLTDRPSEGNAARVESNSDTRIQELLA